MHETKVRKSVERSIFGRFGCEHQPTWEEEQWSILSAQSAKQPRKNHT